MRTSPVLLSKLAAAAMVLFCAASSAEASVITISAADVGDTFSFNAVGTSSGGTPVSVSFSALISSYTFNAGLNQTELALNVTITNTTSTTFDSSLRGYGFNSTPDVIGGTSTSTVFDTVTPNGSGVVETCVADTVESQCTGLSGGGLESGQQNIHTLTLFFLGNQVSVGLGALDGDDSNQAQEGFYFRFLSVEDLTSGAREDSAKIWGSPEERDSVPEPASLALFASALGLGIARLRKQRAN